MYEMIVAGGWVMLLIVLCSVVAMAIIVERLWSLRMSRVVPDNLVAQVWKLHCDGKITSEHVAAIRNGSPLGRILSAGIINREHSREIMKEAIEEVGHQVVHELERYLNTLGTIASISPLLGLLGTVIGMIKVFSAITMVGVGNPTVLAGGISQALLTTAAGLFVAIFTLMFHRYFTGKVAQLALMMEEESLKMVEVMQGERESE